MIAGIQDLVERAKRGDRPAFDELYRQYEAKLSSFCGRFLTYAEDREDAVAETFRRVYQSLGSFDERSSFATWLYKIARNVCLDRLKTPYESSINDENAPVQDPAPPPDKVAEWRDILKAIPRKAEGFDPPWDVTDYKIYLYHSQLGESFREVAEHLRMGEPAVKRRFERKILPVLKAVAQEFGIDYVPKRRVAESKEEGG